VKTAELEEVLGWIRTTDLVEVAFKEGGRGFSLATAEGQSTPSFPLPASRFTPILSPAIGIFQWSRLGESRRIEEGVTLAAGEAIGIVETAPGKSVPVASAAGRVARIFVEAGAAVEFGQPLLFLEG